jgi:hypothetical protein
MNQTRAASQPLAAEMWSRQHSEIILTFVGLEFIGETRCDHPLLLATGRAMAPARF